MSILLAGFARKARALKSSYNRFPYVLDNFLRSFISLTFVVVLGRWAGLGRIQGLAVDQCGFIAEISECWRI